MRRLIAMILTAAFLASCGDDEDVNNVDNARSTLTSINGTPAKGSGLELTKIATAEEPVGLVSRTNDPVLYVVEKQGRIRSLADGKLADAVLDISDKVSTGSEQGLLGLAFSPDGKLGYINYTDTDGDTHIDEYQVDANGTFTGRARELLFVKQPFANHNGGNLAFGPDNRLYVGLGDGGSGGDPNDNAQNPESRLGKMLVLDTAAKNPSVETYALGLRNPWRFSFDRSTGDLWIADVGQGDIEEINHLPAGTPKGANFRMEPSRRNQAFRGQSIGRSGRTRARVQPRRRALLGHRRIRVSR